MLGLWALVQSSSGLLSNTIFQLRDHPLFDESLSRKASLIRVAPKPDYASLVTNPALGS